MDCQSVPYLCLCISMCVCSQSLTPSLFCPLLASISCRARTDRDCSSTKVQMHRSGGTYCNNRQVGLRLQMITTVFKATFIYFTYSVHSCVLIVVVSSSNSFKLRETLQALKMQLSSQAKRSYRRHLYLRRRSSFLMSSVVTCAKNSNIISKQKHNQWGSVSQKVGLTKDFYTISTPLPFR